MKGENPHEVLPLPNEVAAFRKKLEEAQKLFAEIKKTVATPDTACDAGVKNIYQQIATCRGMLITLQSQAVECGGSCDFIQGYLKKLEKIEYFLNQIKCCCRKEVVIQFSPIQHNP
jgi:hypothetical protein